ncbi:amino acid ABC transporter permease [Pantoea vagans]|uniref:amino acid ABC transporter permease n=1 Tax=Pantoea vagans TaxID=470934 RepID=UPI0023AF0B65|nr:amino acid ABC transporter permease [Pantoea vagans]MDE8559326.1 amino acid ABC transporter permease [Pantoea vagans]MDE8579326.1 amino acid ABC transporter permease [Pantoea vagans]
MHIQFDFLAVLENWPLLLTGVCWTIGLTVIATIVGMILGVAFAWSRASGPVWLKWTVGSYVELIRNTPFIVQLFFIFFGLPAAGVRLSPDVAAVIAMVVSLSAYSTEIVRAGLAATPKGQLEAAQSLALSRIQTFLHVILPPALSKVWPAMTGQITLVMLGSAVCSQISVPELSYATNLIQSRNFRSFEASIIATVIYLVLAIVIRKILNWAGPRLLFRG